jgi:GNAT superfamily N-acetyltransferase
MKKQLDRQAARMNPRMAGREVANMMIRRVEPEDELYPAMLARSPSTARYISDPSDTGEYHFFAAIAPGQRVVGGAVIDIRGLGSGPLKDMTVGFLENVEVDEAFRRRGIGTALLQAALSYAWERGAQNVRWAVDWSNEPGIAFYVHCGIGVIPEGESPEKPETYYTLMAVNPQLVATGYGCAQVGPLPQG